jgi:hypothetical protein
MCDKRLVVAQRRVMIDILVDDLRKVIQLCNNILIDTYASATTHAILTLILILSHTNTGQVTVRYSYSYCESWAH